MVDLNARYTDGKTSRVYPVMLDTTRQGLKIISSETHEVLAAWNFGDMHVTQDWQKDSGGIIAHKRLAGAAITCDNQSTFIALLARLDKKDRATFKVPLSIPSILLSLAAAVAVVMVGYPLYGKAMDLAALLIPPAAEKKFGDLEVAAFGKEFEACDDKQTTASLEKIINHLVRSSDLKGQHIDVHLYKTEMANAFALPGNNMAVLTGFLKSAASEDEIAGVMAHELGHISHRDALRLTLQSQGYSLMTHLITGSSGAYSGIGKFASIAQTLQYTREKEELADAYAANLLPKAGYSKRGLANFLGRMLTGAKGKTLQTLEDNFSFLSTHPATHERLAKLQPSRNATASRNILSPSEFRALKNACHGKPQQAQNPFM